MGLFKSLLKNSFDSWLENASDSELSDGYEKRRQDWVNSGFGGNGEPTQEMKKINKEMSKRSSEKWEKDPNRNTDPNFRWTDSNRWDKN